MVFVPDKKCPKCDSNDYRFRGRRNLDDGTETKYRCAPCGYTWKVKTELVLLVKAEDLPPLWEVDAPENLTPGLTS